MEWKINLTLSHQKINNFKADTSKPINNWNVLKDNLKLQRNSLKSYLIHLDIANLKDNLQLLKDKKKDKHIMMKALYFEVQVKPPLKLKSKKK